MGKKLCQCVFVCNPQPMSVIPSWVTHLIYSECNTDSCCWCSPPELSLIWLLAAEDTISLTEPDYGRLLTIDNWALLQEAQFSSTDWTHSHSNWKEEQKQTEQWQDLSNMTTEINVLWNTHSRTMRSELQMWFCVMYLLMRLYNSVHGPDEPAFSPLVATGRIYRPAQERLTHSHTHTQLVRSVVAGIIYSQGKWTVTDITAAHTLWMRK